MLVILIIVSIPVLAFVALKLYGEWKWSQALETAHIQRRMDAARNYRRMCRGR
jgi:hypothetical protein